MKELMISYVVMLAKVLVLFFTPISGIILIVGLATVLDTVFGIWRAYKTKEKVSSKKARHGFVPKLISYIGVVMFVFASDYFIINELTMTAISIEFISTKIIAFILIAIEFKSIDESFKSVKGYSFIEKIVNMITKAKDFKKTLQK